MSRTVAFQLLRVVEGWNARGVFAVLLTAALLLGVPAWAQVSSGSLAGTVTDATGAVIPDATIVLQNQGNNSTRQTVSNTSGFFNFQAVQPATYTVTVTAKGFNTWELKDLEFTQAANKTLPNIALEIAATKQQVEVVSAASEIVPSDTGQSGQTLNTHMITDLAIQGRDAAELIKIMPGMGMNTGLGQGMFSSLVTQNNTGPIGQFSAQGTQPYGGMTMTSDGANLLDPGNQGTQTSNINQNQIQEFSIFTNSYGAEFAKGPITFQAIGKSGTSQFHGDAYLYARNGVFNSTNSLFNATNTKAPQDSYYYPGGDIGGPVIIPHTNFNKNHDKLFFYAAFEDMRQNPEGSLIQRFIPTSQMMAGNFSPAYIASLGSNFAHGPFGVDATPPCNGSSGCTMTSGGATGLTLPGGMIPASLLDPNSAAYYKTFPQPNIDPNSNPAGANYQYLSNTPVDRYELRLRGDYNLSDNTKLFFSWNRQRETDLNPISIWWGTNTDLPYPSSMPADQVSNVYSANVTHIFSPTLTNEFIFAEATFLNPIALTNPAAVDPSKVGFNMTGLFQNTLTPQIPNELSWDNGVPGYFAPSFGQKFQGGDFGKYSSTPNISDNLSKVLGTHTLKFGFYYDFARNWQAASNFQNANQGTIEFENYGANSSGNPAADLAMGRVTELYQENQAIVQNGYYHQYSFYANDQWKATRRLTLTLGIRFDHMGQWIAEGGPGMAVWNPSTYNNTSSAGPWTGLEWNAIDSSIPKSGFPSRLFFYEPRLGVAWDIFGTGKTVLRGGFGIYRYQISNNTASGSSWSAPLGVIADNTTWNCCIGYNSFNQFSPTLGPAGLGTTVSGLMQEGDAATPYTESYNVTVSQRGPRNSLIELQYAGSRSHDSLLDSSLSDIDKIPTGAFYGPDPLTGAINNPFSGSFPKNDYYPLHNYTGVQLIEHGSYSNYNGFIASWQKQTGRATFTTNYTFSKVMGIRDGYTGNGNGAGNVVDPFNINANYGPLAYDHTHIFNAAYIVNLPSPVHGNPFLAGVVNGWELSGITQAQSGPPLQPNANGNLNASYGSTPAGSVSSQTYLGSSSFPYLPPVLTCNPAKNLSSGQYFNPGCFAPPAPGQQGPAVWPYVRGPAFFNSDLSLFKNFKFKERHNVQLRFEAFNFLNHPLPTFNALGNNADVSLVFNNGGNLAQTNQNNITNGKPQYDTGRRVIEFGAKYSF